MAGYVAGGHFLCLYNTVVVYEIVAEKCVERGVTGVTAASILGLRHPGIIAAAAAGGSLEICKYLVDLGAKLDDETSAQAAKEGHIHILEWLATQFCDTSRVVSTAATNGQLGVIQWAMKNIFFCGPGPIEAPTNAAASGHLECLKWMIEHGVKWRKRECFDDATRYEGSFPFPSLLSLC